MLGWPRSGGDTQLAAWIAKTAAVNSRTPERRRVSCTRLEGAKADLLGLRGFFLGIRFSYFRQIGRKFLFDSGTAEV